MVRTNPATIARPIGRLIAVLPTSNSAISSRVIFVYGESDILKDEINKGIVGLRRHHEKRDPEKSQNRCAFRPRDTASPIPSLHPRPSDHRRQGHAKEVVWLIDCAGDQPGTGLWRTESKHALTISQGGRKIPCPKENPGENHDQKSKRDACVARQTMEEALPALATLKREHAAVNPAPDHKIP